MFTWFQRRAAAAYPAAPSGRQFSSNTVFGVCGPTALEGSTTAQPSATLELGTTVRRFGRNLQLSGNGILVRGEGYYKVGVNVVATPEATGDYTVTLLKDGVAIPGATQTITASAAGAVIAFNIPAIARLQCCDSSATLTVALTTTATLPTTVTVNNTAVTTFKL